MEEFKIISVTTALAVNSRIRRIQFTQVYALQFMIADGNQFTAHTLCACAFSA
jgi:hypothetical protein